MNRGLLFFSPRFLTFPLLKVLEKFVSKSTCLQIFQKQIKMPSVFPRAKLLWFFTHFLQGQTFKSKAILDLLALWSLEKIILPKICVSGTVLETQIM